MTTMMVVSYIATWGNIIYSLLTVPDDTELWNEDIE
jgi:hypothetical protein